MPSALPDGDPAPQSGELPTAALSAAHGQPLAFYLHVPFCAVRCGYCDFNTYTPGELGSGARDISTYAQVAAREIDLARRVLPDAGPIATIFVGGGTPTLLPASDLVDLVARIREQFGLADDIEVTTEANPDSVSPQSLQQLADGGFTRVSFGMQSAVPHVLKTLDRTHNPDNVALAVQAAKDAGLKTSLDLIYGTPGESLDDWRTSLEAAVSHDVDHVSAYALVVEEGTKLSAQVRRGEVAAPLDDDEATKYELGDEVLGEAGYGWYEISNWARTDADRCRHNELYWRGASWWGIGPGAHSHVGGVRWWNVKHPGPYAAHLSAGNSPAAGRETLTDEQRDDERVLLGIRLSEGLPIAELSDAGRTAVAGLIADELVNATAALREQRVRLTLRGRLLADTVVRRLLGW